MEWNQGSMRVITDSSQMDIDVIHDFLANEAYWSKGISKEIVTKSIENSLCFGVFKGNTQIGFVRLITDDATFAYLTDLFIITEYQGQGLSKWLLECVFNYPGVKELKRMVAATLNAHQLAAQYGFRSLEPKEAETILHVYNPDVYQ